jgi:hypothetical protein
MLRSFILLFFSCILLSAQDFRLDINVNRAEVNQKIALQYSFNKGTIPENVLPKVKNMIKVGLPGMMNGSSTVNGVTTNTSQLTFEVIFTKPGTYTIPASTLKNKNGKFTCNPVTIQVVRGVDSSPIIPENYVGKEFFLVSQPSRNKVYIGEPVAIDLIAYSYLLSLENANMEIPTFDGGWSKQVDYPKEKMQPSSFQGRTYYKGFMSKIWIIPSILGNREFKSIAAIFYAGLKHEKAGYIEFQYNVRSNPVMFEVIDLPVEDRPASFVNAVGSFSWTVHLDKTNAKANEPIKLKANITGDGNFPTLEPPLIDLPEAFESFEPEIKDNYNVDLIGIHGSKEFEFLIMPRKEGKFWLGPFTFSYFNPQTKKYTELKSDSFLVNINGVIADTTSSTVKVNNGKFEGGKIVKRSDPFFGNPFYYLLLALPFLAGIGMILFRKKLFFIQKDDSEKKLKQAEDKANKALVEARGSVDKLSTLFYQYIADKFKTTRNEITRAHLQHWISNTNAKNLAIKIMDQLDQFRFAPAAQSDLDSLYNNIKTLVDELGK